MAKVTIIREYENGKIIKQVYRGKGRAFAKYASEQVALAEKEFKNLSALVKLETYEEE